MADRSTFETFALAFGANLERSERFPDQYKYQQTGELWRAWQKAHAGIAPIAWQYREYEGDQWHDCRKATYDYWMRPENVAVGRTKVRALTLLGAAA